MPPVERLKITGPMAERAAGEALRRPRPAGPEFVAIGSYRAPAGKHASPHRYAVWKITYYRAGQIDAYVDGVRYPVGPGSVLAVPPLGMHAERAHTAYANEYLLVNAPPSWPWPVASTDRTGELGAAITALQRETAGQPLADVMTGALVTQCDVLLRRLGTATNGASDHSAAATVRRAEAILAAEHTGGLRIAAVAARVGVSVSTLRSYFDTELGVSPQQRLRELRLHHALVLLGSSDLTVETIAVRCGYHSASHLSRHLRAAGHRSPRHLRGTLPTN